jgi:predicted NBD/HSP70 family sugar kinase
MILAVDIGGTKTLVARFDEKGRITMQQRFATPTEYDDFIRTLITTIREQVWQPDIHLIAVAAPGTIGYKNGVILKLGNLHWHDVPIVEELHKAFGVPVVIENDANAGALAAVAALPTTPQLALYITVGTGIGTGVVVNGRIDAALAQSEGGHMVLWHNGEPKIWEEFASGRAIHKEFGRFAYQIEDTKSWQEIGEHLSIGLLALIPAMQPEIVIIGGGIGTHFEKYQQALLAHLGKHLPKMITTPKIIKAANPEEAVIYGCYQLATNNSAA